MRDTLKTLVRAQWCQRRVNVVQKRADSLPTELQERVVAAKTHRDGAEQVEIERDDAVRVVEGLFANIASKSEERKLLEAEAMQTSNATSRQILQHKAREIGNQLARDESDLNRAKDRVVACEETLYQHRGVLADLDKDLAEFRSTAATDEEDFGKDLVQLQIDLAEQVALLSIEFRADFERASAARNGRGVVALNGNACGGCGTNLNPNQVNQTQTNQSVVRCPSCARFLVSRDLWNEETKFMERR